MMRSEASTALGAIWDLLFFLHRSAAPSAQVHTGRLGHDLDQQPAVEAHEDHGRQPPEELQEQQREQKPRGRGQLSNQTGSLHGRHYLAHH